MTRSLFAAALDATLAQIDNEIRGYRSGKRDKAVNRANLLSIVSAGRLGETRVFDFNSNMLAELAPADQESPRPHRSLRKRSHL